MVNPSSIRAGVSNHRSKFSQEDMQKAVVVAIAAAVVVVVVVVWLLLLLLLLPLRVREPVGVALGHRVL